MIYGIGVDLVDNRRMERVLRRWGERFVLRVFTENETDAASDKAGRPGKLALRFAAKEAFSKALGLGMKRGVRWRDIEVFNDPNGRPGLNFYGKTLKICRDRGITGVHLSLSDESAYSIATVVLEKDGG